VPQFFLHGVALKVVKSYKYLGLDVYVSLRWTQMRSRLYAKARAKVASAFGMANCAHVLNVEFGIQLWKSIVRPILEYGCEIWGDSTWKQGEELQKLVAKRILRCPMNVADEAALGELGFWTLKARSDMLRLRYWGELINMSLERIPKCVYNASKRVFEHELRHLLFRPLPVLVGTEKEQRQQQRAYMAPVVHARQTNWCFCTFELLQRYGLDQYWDSEDVGRSWHRQVFKAVQMVEEREWRARMELKPKLRTYRRLKSKLKCEQYLVRSDGEKRVYDLFKLRCGTNLLRVDTGRYDRVRGHIPFEERTCLLCLNGEPEDEAHFMLRCSAFEAQRRTCFNQLAIVLQPFGIAFNGLTESQRLGIVLLSDSFVHWHKVVAPVILPFVSQVYAKRQKLNRLL
jgi:hypothetical protein